MSRKNDVQIRVGADIAGVQSGFRQLQQSMGGLGKVAAGLGAAFAGVFAVGKVAGFGRDSIDTFAEAEAIWSRLDGTLQNAGVHFDAVRGEIEGAAAAMQAVTTLGDEDFAATLTALVQQTGDYSRSLQHVQLVADLAAGKNISFAQASELVGRALAGNASQLQEMFPALKGSTDLLGDLAKMMEGQAARHAKTLQGQLERLNNEWGDFKQAIGAVLSEASGGASVMEGLISTVRGLATWVAANREQLARLARTGVDVLTTAVRGLAENARALAIVLGAGGLVRVLGRLQVAAAAAGGTVVALKTSVRGLFASMGPAGWAVIGVGALAEAFLRLRDAASKSGRAMETALAELRTRPLEEQKKALDEQIRALTEYRDAQRRLANDRSNIAAGGAAKNVERANEQLRTLSQEWFRVRDALREVEGLGSLDNTTKGLGDLTDKLTPVQRQIQGLRASVADLWAELNGAPEWRLIRDLEAARDRMQRLIALSPGMMGTGPAGAGGPTVIGGVRMGQLTDQQREEMRQRRELDGALDLTAKTVNLSTTSVVLPRTITDEVRDTFRDIGRTLVGELQYAAGAAGAFAARMGDAAASADPLKAVGALAGEVLEPLFRELAPAVSALLQPLAIVGGALGRALAPLLEAMFPIFKHMAIVVTYVGQVFFSVGNGIARAMGTLIRAIGKAVDKIPFVSGGPLIRAGESMLDFADEMGDGARDMARARAEIRGLEFGDTAEAVDRLTTSIHNGVPTFNLGLRRIMAAMGGGGGRSPRGATDVERSGGGNVIEIHEVTINGATGENTGELWREFKRAIVDDLRRGGHGELRVAIAEAAR